MHVSINNSCLIDMQKEIKDTFYLRKILNLGSVVYVNKNQMSNRFHSTWTPVIDRFSFDVKLNSEAQKIWLAPLGWLFIK